MQEPESGTTSYTYAYSTTAGQGLTVTRTKPRANRTDGSTTITMTQYDILGRPISVTYNDGVTPNRAFAYDVDTTWSNVTSYNLKGRLATTSSGSGDHVDRVCIYLRRNGPPARSLAMCAFQLRNIEPDLPHPIFRLGLGRRFDPGGRRGAAAPSTTAALWREK